LALPLLVFTAILLALVLDPGIGRQINNARRWLDVGASVFSLPNWRSWL
jgi:cell division protein FtsW (lipid II flippase)